MDYSKILSRSGSMPLLEIFKDNSAEMGFSGDSMVKNCYCTIPKSMGISSNNNLRVNEKDLKRALFINLA